MTESLTTENGRQVLRLERKLAHPPEKVWRALTEPARLSQWYPLTCTGIDLRVGGTINFDDGEGTTYAGAVTELVPERVFAFSEESDLLHIELRPDGPGTLLIFTHTFDDPDMGPATAKGWHNCLTALTDSLAA